jgi:hypothetical protein
LLVAFLERVVEERAAPADAQVYTTLLELYLKVTLQEIISTTRANVVL